MLNIKGKHLGTFSIASGTSASYFADQIAAWGEENPEATLQHILHTKHGGIVLIYSQGNKVTVEDSRVRPSVEDLLQEDPLPEIMEERPYEKVNKLFENYDLPYAEKPNGHFLVYEPANPKAVWFQYWATTETILINNGIKNRGLSYLKNNLATARSMGQI